MRRGGLKWGIVAALILAGVLVAWLGGNSKVASFRSLPKAERPWAQEEWERHTTDPPKPAYTAQQFFDGHQFVRDNSKLAITSSYSESLLPYRLAEQDLYTLESIAVALPGPVDPALPDPKYPLNYFAKDGETPLTAEQVAKLAQVDQETQLNGVWPKVRLDFRKTTECQLSSARIFDYFTHVRQSSGALMSNPNPEQAWCETEIATWRRVGLVAILDSKVGELQRTEMEPKPGSQLTLGDMELRLMMVAEDVGNGPTYNSKDTRFYFAKVPQGHQRWRAGFFIAVYPYAENVPLTFRLLDKEGKRLRSNSYQVKNSGYAIDCEVSPTEVAKIEVGYHESYARQILELPPLPLLPRENDNLRDLFDMQAPYVRFQRDHSPFLIEGMADVNMNLRDVDFREGYYGIQHDMVELRDVTAMDLLKALEQDTHARTVYQYDRKTHQMEVTTEPESPWWRRMWPF